jgi:hypothetical protein
MSASGRFADVRGVEVTAGERALDSYPGMLAKFCQNH